MAASDRGNIARPGAKMRRKNRVLLADGDSEFSTRVARSLAMDSGFQTYAVSTVAQTALRYSRNCHRFEYHSVSDGSSTESLARRLLARAKELEIDVVLAVQNAIPVLSTHRSLFESAGVHIAPTPAIEAYGITVDKGAFARWVAAHDLPHPRTVVLDGRAQTRSDLDSLKYPLLYKPCRAGYGHGIRRLQDESSVCEFLEGQKKRVKHGISRKRSAVKTSTAASSASKGR